MAERATEELAGCRRALAEAEAELDRVRAENTRLRAENAALLRAAVDRNYERPPHYE